ncbi:hypothetical protein HN858_05615 [Candidatus Falkowbacteria bacterium]|jgi:hypothetical protein|nr:hypothetical protein [Candidatus Falkowbacteria bacterium]MBT5502898.1 hypothetical protein [Candidatus Falkowbacteria bacterium]MBT6573738.1 hypothetical protein [Candidatus Falkowbacteria bacterium]MBT7349114.1 hypothetical protein [Candidatus Falkowbacteria bacterium]MBT7500065.1 hypothetical protein [Candidatus Falkowbacteria bacterium]
MGEVTLNIAQIAILRYLPEGIEVCADEINPGFGKILLSDVTLREADAPGEYYVVAICMDMNGHTYKLTALCGVNKELEVQVTVVLTEFTDPPQSSPRKYELNFVKSANPTVELVETSGQEV